MTFCHSAEKNARNKKSCENDCSNSGVFRRFSTYFFNSFGTYTLQLRNLYLCHFWFECSSRFNFSVCSSSMTRLICELCTSHYNLEVKHAEAILQFVCLHQIESCGFFYRENWMRLKRHGQNDNQH